MDFFDGIDPSDKRVNAMLCRWAGKKYGIPSVTHVRFDFQKGYGGGCDTCGYGADEDSLAVVVTNAAGQQRFDATYDTGLLNEILASAA